MRWRPAGQINRGELPPSIREFLLESGSLTQQLESHCSGVFNLELSGQSWQRPLFDEEKALTLHTGAFALVREIYLKCNQQPWIYGRSIIPAGTFTGAERRLAHWGQRSLGDYLFTGRKARRGRIEITKLLPQDRLFQLAVKNRDTEGTELWGRRSIFYIKNKPLLVVEVFLTGVIQCMNAGKN